MKGWSTTGHLHFHVQEWMFHHCMSALVVNHVLCFLLIFVPTLALAPSGFLISLSMLLVGFTAVISTAHKPQVCMLSGHDLHVMWRLCETCLLTLSGNQVAVSGCPFNPQWRSDWSVLRLLSAQCIGTERARQFMSVRSKCICSGRCNSDIMISSVLLVVLIYCLRNMSRN